VAEEVDMDRWHNPDWANRMTVRVDFSHVMSDFVGNERGLTQIDIDELANKASVIADDIARRRENSELGFYQLPYDFKTLDEISRMALSIRKKCEYFVVLGIGGSALGGIALFHSLCHPLHNLIRRSNRDRAPRAFFLENIDPKTFNALLDFVDLEKTVFNVVTKSGTTIETLSQFLIIQKVLSERLSKSSVKEHIVITTGEKPGNLKYMAEAEGCPILSIPENVGGRFSVFSPVGLLPAAVCGIDIAELLAGARHADERCKQRQFKQNPAFLSGALHYLADVKKGLNIVVMMPYSDALVQVANWFRQLWAESLGKERTTSGKAVNVGQTPVVALGVTDQHSQLQLYLEGPFNKLIDFLLVEETGGKINIPKAQKSTEGISYLSSHTLNELMRVEAQSTQYALAQAGRSNMSFMLPEVNPFTIGQLLFMLQVQTVFTAGLYEVNPLDQPRVEASKRYIYGLMGRRGFQDSSKEIKEWLSRERRYTV
jgi:glucose-6-phosphate isomerase